MCRGTLLARLRALGLALRRAGAGHAVPRVPDGGLDLVPGGRTPALGPVALPPVLQIGLGVVPRPAEAVAGGPGPPAGRGPGPGVIIRPQPGRAAAEGLMPVRVLGLPSRLPPWPQTVRAR